MARLCLRYLLVCVFILMSGCSPSLSPLYRDYEVHTNEEPLDIRIKDALEEAGWTLDEGGAPNVIATKERRLRSWGLYNVVASIEMVPIGRSHVRVYIHPYRHYITGGQSKIPFLKATIRSAVLKNLEESLESRGLLTAGTGVSRDRKLLAR